MTQYKPESKRAQVSRILIHPIKSCRGTSVLEARYTPEGLEHDRKWSIVSADTNKILTAREIPRLVLVAPSIRPDPTSPYGGVLDISFPDDSSCESFCVPLYPTKDILQNWQTVDDMLLHGHHGIDGYICQGVPALPGALNESVSSILSKYCGRPVHLVCKGPVPRICAPTFDFPNLDASLWYQDGYPLLVLSEESVAAAEQEVRAYVGVQGVEEKWREDKLVIERFRPNIVLKGAGAFAEDVWEEISIGGDDGNDESMDISLVSKCARCLLPNVHPETGIRDKAVPFKVLMKFRSNVDPRMKMQPCMGVNGVPAASGVVKVGQWVEVKKLLTPPIVQDD